MTEDQYCHHAKKRKKCKHFFEGEFCLYYGLDIDEMSMGSRGRNDCDARRRR